MADQIKTQNLAAGPVKGQIMEISNAELSSQINNLSRRLRILEERYTNLRKKTQVTDQNMISANKRANDAIRNLNTDSIDITREVEDIKEKIKIIIRELKVCAKYDEVKVLERYINLWEPMRYATHAEVEAIVQKMIKEKLEGM